jgi:hypothetical protein
MRRNGRGQRAPWAVHGDGGHSAGAPSSRAREERGATSKRSGWGSKQRGGRGQQLCHGGHDASRVRRRRAKERETEEGARENERARGKQGSGSASPNDEPRTRWHACEHEREPCGVGRLPVVGHDLLCPIQNLPLTILPQTYN